jgi:hypothetical protein
VCGDHLDAVGGHEDFIERIAVVAPVTDHDVAETLVRARPIGRL